jgi:DNA-binding IclR family transcriptional regulator
MFGLKLFSVANMAEGVLIEKVKPPGLVRLATWVGKRLELHCSAVGKCLLAYLLEREFLRVVRDRGLTRHNENTITLIRKLKQEVTQIRAATTAQIRSEEFSRFGQLVRQTAFDISKSLGFIPVRIESSGQQRWP